LFQKNVFFEQKKSPCGQLDNWQGQNLRKKKPLRATGQLAGAKLGILGWGSWG